MDEGDHDVSPGEADVVADPGRDGPHDAPRSIRTVFADATDAYAAVDELRARGFKIELAASVDGDLIVSIQAGRTRADEVDALVAAHAGRVEAASRVLPSEGVSPGSSDAVTG